MKRLGIAITCLLFAACHRERPVVERPSILLVTLDTTRADAIGPEAKGVETPSFNALVLLGMRFRDAYCAVPQTLPSHTSMMTGLYAGGHGVHENARHLADTTPLLAERLHAAGYRTAAFISAFALAKRFGLARGFDVWDEDFGANRAERNAQETTDRALAFLHQQSSSKPLFLWVHYWDPHYPYTPPEPFATKYAKNPYYGEVAFMDEQLGRLVAAFQQSAQKPVAMIFVGDHGEGLGEHGEQQHGNLMYQATMHVPLLLIGPGVKPGTSDAPVSTRRIFHTILDWAGIDAGALSLLADARPSPGASRHPLPKGEGVVAAEAMKAFLDYGWQPQVMAVDGSKKAILAGSLEVYNVAADPGETHNLAPQASLSREQRATLRDYPIPSLAEAANAASPGDSEERKKLASLGYVTADVKPVVRKDAPRPADMAPLFPILDEAASLFVREEYAKSIPLLQEILVKDPHNLDAALRLATAESALGHDERAVAAFERAQAIAPDSPDVRTYFALHLARTKDWKRAEPMLEQVLAQTPEKVPAIEALESIREREGRLADAVTLLQKLYTLRAPSGAESAHLGTLAMRVGDTNAAITAFEKVSGHDLELGVLYLAAHRFPEARDALDRIPPSHPDYPMVLFKRAQVAVLLHEPDAPARIEAAKQHANPMTRELIARERLFQ
ncbi:MAG TPA: sulfatase-like hydrolase/transferase [Thermoanaerobaculia bacterium]|nr:sulfatase-like hydrolase/transferase [Thermoanaerobaculia bacterium]